MVVDFLGIMILRVGIFKYQVKQVVIFLGWEKMSLSKG